MIELYFVEVVFAWVKQLQLHIVSCKYVPVTFPKGKNVAMTDMIDIF